MKLLVPILLFPWLLLWEAYAVTVLWAAWIMPLMATRAITLPEGAGLVLLVQLLRPLKPHRGETTWMDIANWTAAGLLNPLMAILITSVLKYFA